MVFPRDVLKKDGLAFSLNLSDLAHSMVDFSSLDNGNDKHIYVGLSLGYFREDNNSIQSGFGFQYILNIDQSYIEDSSAENVNLYGLGVYTFIEKQASFARLGLKSYYDFGNSDYNFIMGPTIGVLFNFANVDFNINYFRGCADFVNFSRFINYIEFSVKVPLKGRNS